MLIKMKTKKAMASHWLIISFALLLLVSAAISEFFQAPSSNNHDLNKLTALFNPEEMQLIQGLTITNKLGEFQLRRTEPFELNRWQVITPRQLEASSQTISLILDTLKSITIKKVFDKDPINMASFSLTVPVMTIQINTIGSEATSVLEVGLSNPIDNSTYLTFNGQQVIFQVEALKAPLETFDLAQFVNTSLFMALNSEISYLALYRGKNVGQPIFALEYKDNAWTQGGKHDINQELVADLLDSLRKSKGQIILDTLNDKQEPIVSRAISQPAYSLIVKENGVEMTYYISQPTLAIPGVKIEKGQSVIVSSPQKNYPILVHKELLNLFANHFNFRDQTIKKFSY